MDEITQDYRIVKTKKNMSVIKLRIIRNKTDDVYVWNMINRMKT